MGEKRKRGLRRWCARFLRRLLWRLDNPPPDRSGTGPSTMEIVFRKIEEAMMEQKLYLQRGLTLETLARAAGVNRTYVSRSLAAHKLNYATYVNGYRLQQAVQLMQDDPQGELELEEIAHRSGFCTERRMGVYLKMSYGVPLVVFRRRIKAFAQAKNFSTALSASGNANTAT